MGRRHISQRLWVRCAQPILRAVTPGKRHGTLIQDRKWKRCKLGAGETFRGEGILAVTKALLQSGVSYVGGYQGAPVSHLLDVMVDAEDLLADLGVHVETCTNEASAAAMLGASINYPLRGAVTWKSIVGTNVAADALSNLASPGVLGGALIILGEDYGEGASVIQERSYAYAMKSSMWLLDPRPDLPTIVTMVEKGFELSEASHAPVMMELRIRACHVTGEFVAKDNRRAGFSSRNRIAGPPRFEYARLAHPPVIFAQERLKVEDRLPAARTFIREHKLNEVLPGDIDDVGIIVMGGLTNSVLRALARLDLADIFGDDARSRSMCSTSSIRWCLRRCARSAPASAPCWWSRKARPTTSSSRSMSNCAAPTSRPACSARARCRRPANTRPKSLLKGLAAFLAEARPHGLDVDRGQRHALAIGRSQARRRQGGRRAAAAPADLLHRLPGAAGVHRHQADAARAWADAYLRPTSAATRSRPSRRSAWATRSSATACRSRAPPRSGPISTAGRSP